MAHGWLHTVYREGQWINEIEGGGPMTKHESRSEAIESGRDTARLLGTVHVTHSISGEVRDTRGFGPVAIKR
ncbi:MAG TPA: DUF2188 domain-containing protein [Solirubrobacterales bacterium]|jgi:hypothetical protein